MNILNKRFDRIYLITSFSTINRYYDLKPILQEQEIEVDLIVATKQQHFNRSVTTSSTNLPGNWSHQGAFESIFLKSKLLGLGNFLIFEDDIVFGNNYIETFEKYYSSVPNDWQILHMGYHIDSTRFTDKIYYKFESNMNAIGSHAIVYKNDIVDLVLEHSESNTSPIDLFLNYQIYTRCNTYIANYSDDHKIFYQSSYRHYERDKNYSYKKYPSAIDLKTE